MSSGPASRWRVLGIASVASFLVYLDVTVVNVAFPDIEGGFPDASRAGLSWVLAAYNITFAALLVPGGRIADRVGRRRLFLAGLVVFCGASAACSAAPSAEALIGARIVQAIGGAALVPAAQGLVLEAFPLRERSTAVSLWVAAGAVAAALGPPLGGVIVEVGDWRWVFLVNLPIGLATLAWGAATLPESRDPAATRFPDPLGILLAGGSVGLLTLGIVQGGEWGWSSAAVLGSFAVSAALGGGLVARSRGRANAAVDLRLFGVRSFSLANAASVMMGIAFYGQIFAAVLFMTTVWGYSALEAGLGLAPAPVAAAIAAGLGGRRAEGHPLLPMTIAGILAFVAGSLWLYAALGAEPAYASEILPGTLLLGAGSGLAVSMLATRAAQSLPPARFAVGGAVNSATRQIGAALGVAIVVAVVGTPAPGDAVDAFAAGWLVIGGAAVGALALTAAMLRDPSAALSATARRAGSGSR